MIFTFVRLMISPVKKLQFLFASSVFLPLPDLRICTPRYTRYAAPIHARMLTENGEASEGESLAVSRERLTALRNNGEENILRVIEDGASGETVGYIWYKFVSEEARKFAYTVYIYILEGRRDLGYGTAALKALETLALEKGFNEMRLCVWEIFLCREYTWKKIRKRHIPTTFRLTMQSEKELIRITATEMQWFSEV